MKSRAYLPICLFAIMFSVLFSLNNLYAQTVDKRLGAASGLQKNPTYDPVQVKSGKGLQVKTPDDKCAVFQPKGFFIGQVVTYRTHMATTGKSESAELSNKTICAVELWTGCGSVSGVVAPHAKHLEDASQAALVCETLKAAFIANENMQVNYDNGPDKVEFGKGDFYIYEAILTKGLN